MENQMDNKMDDEMDDEMEAIIVWVIYAYLFFCHALSRDPGQSAAFTLDRKKHEY